MQNICEVGCCNINDSVKKLLKKSVPTGNVTVELRKIYMEKSKQNTSKTVYRFQ